MTKPLDVDDAAVLESGELFEFSRFCWIAAVQNLAAESRLVPAEAPASSPQDHSPWQEAPTAEPSAEQLMASELQERIGHIELQLPQTPSDSTQCPQELEARLSQHGAELEQVRVELARQSAEREQSESSWRAQLDTAWAAKTELESAWTGALEYNMRLEEELAKLRQAHDELNQKLAEGQASQDHIRELEADRAAATERSRTLETDLADLEQELDELHSKLASDQNDEAGRTAAVERGVRLESELESVSLDRDKLAVQLESEQQLSAQAACRVAEVQQRLDGLTVELELFRTESEQLRSDRERAESDWSEQLDAAKSSARELDAGRTAAVERGVRLESELESVSLDRDKLAVQLESEQQLSAQAACQVAEVQQRLDGLTAELELFRAETEQLRSDRERAESDWTEQLDATKALAANLSDAWTESTELNHRFEGEVASLRQEQEQLHAKLAATQLEAAESESRLAKMAEEVQRLSEENAKYKGTLSIDPRLLQADPYTFENSTEKPVRRKSPAPKKGRRLKPSKTRST